MREKEDSYREFLRISKINREGTPHSRRTVKALWKNLRTAYKNAPVGMAFIEQMASGPRVPILYPDDDLMTSGRILGYQKMGDVYVPAHVAPDVFLHELRHVNQRRNLDPVIYDSYRETNCPRSWFLANALIEAEALTFEHVAAGGSSRILTNLFHGRIYSSRLLGTYEPHLKEIFGMSVKDLGRPDLSDPPIEQEITHGILNKICVLPNGENYMFGGKDLTEQWKVAGQITQAVLPPPVPSQSFFGKICQALRFDVLRSQTPRQIGIGGQASHGPEGR